MAHWAHNHADVPDLIPSLSTTLLGKRWPAHYNMSRPKKNASIVMLKPESVLREDSSILKLTETITFGYSNLCNKLMLRRV